MNLKVLPEPTTFSGPFPPGGPVLSHGSKYHLLAGASQRDSPRSALFLGSDLQSQLSSEHLHCGVVLTSLGLPVLFPLRLLLPQIPPLSADGQTIAKFGHSTQNFKDSFLSLRSPSALAAITLESSPSKS